MERIAIVREEQGVVAQRTHRYANLVEVKNVLQQRYLSERNSVTDTMAAEDGGSQMICVAGLAAMWPQQEGVKSSLFPERIE